MNLSTDLSKVLPRIVILTVVSGAGAYLIRGIDSGVFEMTIGNFFGAALLLIGVAMAIHLFVVYHKRESDSQEIENLRKTTETLVSTIESQAMDNPSSAQSMEETDDNLNSQGGERGIDGYTTKREGGSATQTN